MLDLWQNFINVMNRGGVVMWPLLFISAIAAAIILERCWFFWTINRASSIRHLNHMQRLLRQGENNQAKELSLNNDGIYSKVVQQFLEQKVTESSVISIIESQRYALERFLPALSTIITAAPMLGILGTVLGIINSFQILSTQTASGDPKAISMGIAEALITTAAGLMVALIALFPYNAFRAQVDRTLSRLESLGAAALREKDVKNMDDENNT